jgi:hypothetical protein
MIGRAIGHAKNRSDWSKHAKESKKTRVGIAKTTYKILRIIFGLN